MMLAPMPPMPPMPPMAEGEEGEEESEEEGTRTSKKAQTASTPKPDQMSNDELIDILGEEAEGEGAKGEKGAEKKNGGKGEDDDGIPDSLDDMPDVDFDGGVPDIEGVDEEALAAEAKAKMMTFEPLLPPPPFL